MSHFDNSTSLNAPLRGNQTIAPIRTLRALWSSRSVRAALFAFLLSRAIVFVLFVVITQTRLMDEPKPFGELNHAVISVEHLHILQNLRTLAPRGDGGWYWGIAKFGYEHAPSNTLHQHNWAFFPLYPLLARLVSSLTGDTYLAGMAVSNALFFFALILLHKLSLACSYDDDDAERTVYYNAIFPTSYFFSLVMSESLFLMLALGAFYSAKRGRWWLAGCIGALASATRVVGILLLPALLILFWQEQRSTRFRRDVLAVLLVPLGLLSYMVYLYSITGNAFAFVDAVTAWERHTGLFWQPVWDYLRRPKILSIAWNFRLLNFLSALLALGCGCALIKRREWTLAAFTFLSVLVPLSSGSLDTMDRYVLVTFPVFMVLAVAGRSTCADRVIQTIFVTLFGLMTALFAAHVSLAMA